MVKSSLVHEYVFTGNQWIKRAREWSYDMLSGKDISLILFC